MHLSVDFVRSDLHKKTFVNHMVFNDTNIISLTVSCASLHSRSFLALRVHGIYCTFIHVFVLMYFTHNKEMKIKRNTLILERLRTRMTTVRLQNTVEDVLTIRDIDRVVWIRRSIEFDG